MPGFVASIDFAHHDGPRPASPDSPADLGFGVSFFLCVIFLAAAFFAETFRTAFLAVAFFAAVLPTVERVVFAFFEAIPLPPRRVRELRLLPGRAVGIIGLLGADLEHQVIPVDHLFVLAAPEYPLDL